MMALVVTAKNRYKARRKPFLYVIYGKLVCHGLPGKQAATTCLIAILHLLFYYDKK